MSLRLVQGAYLADTARVMGMVTLGADVSVWYGAAVRGDLEPIVIGSATNVQENAVIHCDRGVPMTIGCRVTVGHGAIVHGEAVGDLSLIGMGAVLLSRTKIGRECIIAAGTVLTPGSVVPDGVMVMGVPGKVVRPLTDEERSALPASAEHYVELARLHTQHPGDRRVVPLAHTKGNTRV